MTPPPAPRALRALLGACLLVAMALSLWALSIGAGSSREAAAEPRASRSATSPGLRPRLVIYRKLGGGLPIERLSDGALARPGDLVQVAYRTGGRPGAVIASIDGAGQITLHHPSVEAPAPVDPHGEHAVPRAFELDEAPGFERFFMVTSAAPVEPGRVIAALERLRPELRRSGSLALPEGWVQTSLALDKSPAPP